MTKKMSQKSVGSVGGRRKRFLCSSCNKDFYSLKWDKNRTPKYCTKECYSQRNITEETRQKMSIAKKGKEPWNKGVKMWEGKVHPRGTLGKRKLGNNHGENHWNWKGGITNKNDQVRKSADYKKWKREVIERDGNKCVLCGDNESKIIVDHIIPFSICASKRLDVGNGRALCHTCHRNTDTYGGKMHRVKNKIITPDNT